MIMTYIAVFAAGAQFGMLIFALLCANEWRRK